MVRKKISNYNDELDLKLFFYITRKSLLIIVFLSLIVLASAFFYLRYTPSIYQTSSILQLTQQEEVNDIFSRTKTYHENNLSKYTEVLRSPEFLKKVVDKLPTQISYFSVGTILNFELYKSAPFSIEIVSIDETLVKWGMPIFVDFDKSLKNAVLSCDMPDCQFEKKIVLGDTSDFLGVRFILEIINEPAIIENQKSIKSNGYYFIFNNQTEVINQLTDNLSIVVLNSAANTIEISLKDKNPAKAADFVNTIANEFIKFDIERKQESTKKILEYIDEQLNAFYDKLYQSENELSSFKKRYHIDSSTQKPLPTIFTRISELEDEVFRISLKVDVLHNLQNDISQKTEIDVYKLIARLSSNNFDNHFSQSISVLQDLLVRKEKLLFEVTANSKQIEALNYQILIQKNILKESIQELLKHLEDKKKETQKKIFEYEKHTLPQSINYSQIELSRLERIHSINEKFYWQLVDKKAEYSISNAGYVSQFTVLKSAELPQEAIYPIKRNVYVLAMLIALILSFSLVFIRYVLHNDIQSVADINKYSDIPILGTVPIYSNKIPVSQLIVDKNPKSIISESLRTIRTNLQFFNPSDDAKVIALTSTISGEGKTFVAINLAGIISFSNKKVIVIDLDMRKPKIHLGFGVENNKGMSTILSGQHNLDECIRQSELSFLSFITAGPVPPNPSELMLSKTMKKVIEKLKKEFDYIILDNPPVGIVTDALISFQFADFPIYIFKANYSKKVFIQTVHNIMKETNIKNIAIVLNAVERNFISYGRSYHNYGGYGYGYAYNYYEEQNPERSNLLKKLLFKRKGNNESN